MGEARNKIIIIFVSWCGYWVMGDGFWEGVLWGLGYSRARRRSEKRIKCAFCGRLIAGDSRFCPYCGRKLRG